MLLRRLTALAATAAATLVSLAVAQAPSHAAIASGSVSPSYAEPSVATAFTATIVTNGSATNTIVVSPEWDWPVSYGSSTTDTVTVSGNTITCNTSGIVFTAVGGTWSTPATRCDYVDGGVWDPANHIVKLIDAVADAATTSITVLFPSGVVTPLQSTRGYGIWTLNTNNGSDVQVRVSTLLPGEAAPLTIIDTLDFDGNGGTCSPDKKKGVRGTWAQALTWDNCSNAGGELLGFSTSPTNAAGSVFVKPGGSIYFGGSNRLYAIWAKPAVAPGAPTDVVAVPGRNMVSLTWKAPVSDGGAPITNYLAQATPSGKVCYTRLTDPNMLGCTMELPGTNTKYTFTVQALNRAGWGAYSSPSSAVSPFDLVVTEAQRERQGVILGAWLGGSTVSFAGRAPGIAPGTTVSPQLKVGAGGWVSETSKLPKVREGGTVTWSKKLARSTNDQPVEVRFVVGAEASNSYALRVGQVAGVPLAPRNVKLSASVMGRGRITWQAPAGDGGSPITSYSMTSDLPGFESCTTSGTKTACDSWIDIRRVNPTKTYEIRVSASNTVGAGKPGKASWRGQIGRLYINFLRQNPNWTREGEQVTVGVGAEGYKPFTKLGVEMRIGDSGPWKKQRGGIELDAKGSGGRWTGVLDSNLRSEKVFFRVTGPLGTTAEKQLEWLAKPAWRP